MRALSWSCMAIVSIVFGDAVGCGGRLEVADCGQGRQFCAETNVCCPDFTICGDGRNGCPPGDCCLSTTSHIVDGGTEGGAGGSTQGSEIAPPDPGSEGPGGPNPGSLPGSGGGGGGPSSGHNAVGDKHT